MIKEEHKDANKDTAHDRYANTVSELEKTLINSPHSETARFELIVKIAKTINHTEVINLCTKGSL